MALLSLQQIHKTFEKGTVNENHVLRGLDLDIEQGDFISVIGGNGAGKSTLIPLASPMARLSPVARRASPTCVLRRTTNISTTRLTKISPNRITPFSLDRPRFITIVTSVLCPERETLALPRTKRLTE